MVVMYSQKIYTKNMLSREQYTAQKQPSLMMDNIIITPNPNRFLNRNPQQEQYRTQQPPFITIIPDQNRILNIKDKEKMIIIIKKMHIKNQEITLTINR